MTMRDLTVSRPLNEEYVSIIQKIQNIDALKFAVDMPSGVNADNGQIMAAALRIFVPPSVPALALAALRPTRMYPMPCVRLWERKRKLPSVPKTKNIMST